ncbi:MAG TPA: hypothetical protein VIJ31_02320 [Acidothermaceae bacterium]
MSVSYLPPTRDLRPERIATMRAELEAFVAREEPATRWWRKRRNITGSLVVALIVATGGGTAAAYAYLHPRAVTDKGYARCYSEAVYVPGAKFAGTTIASGVGVGNPGIERDALDTCASLWQVGALRSGAPRGTPPVAGATYSVPALVGCTLPDGIAAIFPGPPDTCDQLGLAPESPAAVRTATTPAASAATEGPSGSSP